MGAQTLFSDASVAGDGSRPLYPGDERFRKYHRFPQRPGKQPGVECFSCGRMARGPSREPTIRNDRPSRERRRRNLLDVALSDGSHSMVAGNHALASQPERELEIEFCATQLGPAQCARILVFLLCCGVGNLGNLLFLSTSV